MSFTDKQTRLIDVCLIAGHGWHKFAASVKQSGQCSAAQEATLYSMVQRIQLKKEMKARYARSARCSGEHDISDNEAARSGDFF